MDLGIMSLPGFACVVMAVCLMQHVMVNMTVVHDHKWLLVLPVVPVVGPLLRHLVDLVILIVQYHMYPGFELDGVMFFIITELVTIGFCAESVRFYMQLITTPDFMLVMETHSR
jgi:hypothetical protein